MKKIISILFLSLIFNNIHSQFLLEDSVSCTEDGYVYTPFGLALKSKVHSIDNRHYINNYNGKIQIIKKGTGKVAQEFKAPSETKGLIHHSQVLHSSFLEDGWITFADAVYNDQIAGPISSFSADWKVPYPPKNKSKQLIYIFNGLQTIKSGIGYIVQPVLQWGISPAGGGNYWAICNWYVTSNEYFHDSLIIVQPGTNLQGTIRLTSTSDSLFSYNSSFTGYPTSLQVNNIPKLYGASVALEAYNIKDCLDYPIDEKLRFSNIQINLVKEEHPLVSWTVVNFVTECGQFTEIAQNTNNGEIIVHLHSASTIENFSDIHFYPNPANDYIHISPQIPIHNCRIDLFNSTGKLIFTKFYKDLSDGTNINLDCYADGLYFIKFSYNSISRDFKIIKIKNR